jgi:hypothetical protein
MFEPDEIAIKLIDHNYSSLLVLKNRKKLSAITKRLQLIRKKIKFLSKTLELIGKV